MGRVILLAPFIACVVTLATPARPAAHRMAARWFVGEKVVCVNNRFLDLADAPQLVEGDVYTIKRVLPPSRGHWGIAVEEVEAGATFAAFDERRFAMVGSFAETVAECRARDPRLDACKPWRPAARLRA